MLEEFEKQNADFALERAYSETDIEGLNSIKNSLFAIGTYLQGIYLIMESQEEDRKAKENENGI